MGATKPYPQTQLSSAYSQHFPAAFPNTFSSTGDLYSKIPACYSSFPFLHLGCTWCFEP